MLNLLNLAFMWLTEQLSCYQGRQEILVQQNPMEMINDLLDQLGVFFDQTKGVENSAGESLLSTVGTFACALTKKLFKVTKM